MADETLNITVVEDNNGTNKLVTALNNLANTTDKVADSTERSVGASKEASNTRTAEAAATDRAAKSVKGYVDANGNYIRQVGSNATATKNAADAQSALTQSFTATAGATSAAGAAMAPFVSSVSRAGNVARDLSSGVSSIAISAATVGQGVRTAATSIGTLNTATTSAASASRDVANATKDVGSALAATVAPTQAADSALKGYVTSSGAYIRNVGSQREGFAAAAAANEQLSASLDNTGSALSRAATMTGPVVQGSQQAARTSAEFQASINALNRELAGLPPVTTAAATAATNVGAAADTAAKGVKRFGGTAGDLFGLGDAARTGLAPLAPAIQQVTVASQSGNGWINQYRQSLFTVPAAANAAAAAGRTAASGAAAAGAGAAGAVGPLGQLGAAMRQIQSASGGLVTALGAIGVAVGANSFIKAADTYTVVQNKLRLLTTDQTKLNAIMNTAFEIAQRTSSPFESIAGLYGKISLSATAMGLSQKQAADATEALALSFQASGANGEKVKSAVEQFTQGLNKGKVEVQDFKIIMEGAPVVQNAMLVGLRAIGVTVQGPLSEALSQGKITAQQMIQALAASKQTMADFALTAGTTVAQAMTRLENAFLRYVGQANEGNSITGRMISALDFLGKNLDTVIPIAAGLAGVLAFGVIAGAINSVIALGGAMLGLASAMGGAVVGALSAVTTGIVTMGGALIANPLLFAAAAVAAAAAGAVLYKYGDSIKSVIQAKLGLGPAAQNAAAGLNNTAAAATSAAAAAQLAANGTKGAAAGVKETGEAAANSNVSINAYGIEIQKLAAGGEAYKGAAIAVGVEVRKVASAAQASAAAIAGTAQQVRQASGGFTEISGTAGQASGAFGQVGASASGASGGFVELSGTAASAAAQMAGVTFYGPGVTAGFQSIGAAIRGVSTDIAPTIQTLDQFEAAQLQVSAANQNTANSSLQAAAANYANATSTQVANTAAGQSAARQAEYKAAVESTKNALDGANAKINEAVAALAKTVPGTQEAATAQKVLEDAFNTGASAADKAAAAQKRLADEQKSGAAAAKASAVAQALTGSEVNALGEKLTSLSRIMQLHEQQVQAEAEQYKRFQAEGAAASAMLDKQQQALQNNQTAVAATNGLFNDFSIAVAGSNAALSQGQSALSGYAQGLGNVGAAAEDATAKLIAGQKAARDFFNIGQSPGISGDALVSAYRPRPIPAGHTVATRQKEFGGNGFKIIQNIEVDGGIDWSGYSAEARAAGQKVEAAGLGDKAAFAAADAVQSKVNKTLTDKLDKPGGINNIADLTPRNYSGNIGSEYGGVYTNSFATGGDFIVGQPNSVRHFAGGGGFMVGGGGGTDSQLVQFMASPNERVTIETPGQRMPQSVPTVVKGSQRRVQPIVNVQIKADDYGQFKRSQRQIAQDIGERIGRAM